MKSEFKVLFVIGVIFFFSCKSEKQEEHEEIEMRSSGIMKSVIEDIDIHGYHINPDSLNNIFNKLSKDSIELALEFARKIREDVDNLNEVANKKIDSLNKIAEAHLERENLLKQKKWENTKVGRIQKKHPEWSEEECERIADHQIWIGMSIRMLVYERGNPNSANPSNYGDGVNWQWCWYNYTPSCFYGRDDGIVTSYN